MKLLHVALETDPGLSSFAERPTHSRHPDTWHTHDNPCRVSVVFPKEEARAGAPCLGAPRGVGQHQAQGPAVLTPSPRPPFPGRKRDCPVRAGDYTANPGSDLSPWIPPSGVAEAGQDGAGGWILSSSLSNWVRGTQSRGEKAARRCCGWEMLGMG